MLSKKCNPPHNWTFPNHILIEQYLIRLSCFHTLSMIRFGVRSSLFDMISLINKLVTQVWFWWTNSKPNEQTWKSSPNQIHHYNIIYSSQPLDQRYNNTPLKISVLILRKKIEIEVRWVVKLYGRWRNNHLELTCRLGVHYKFCFFISSWLHTPSQFSTPHSFLFGAKIKLLPPE